MNSQDNEREQRLWDALDECYMLGASEETMETLKFETGASQWQPPQQKAA